MSLASGPIGEILDGLEIPSLPEDAEACGLIGFVQLDEPDGGIGWVVRVTSDIDDDEILGMLVGYVEHLKQEASDAWDDTDPTRPEEGTRHYTDGSDNPASATTTAGDTTTST